MYHILISGDVADLRKRLIEDVRLIDVSGIFREADSISQAIDIIVSRPIEFVFCD